MAVAWVIFLVVGFLSLVVLFFFVRRAFRQVMSLGRTVAASAERIASASAPLDNAQSSRSGEPTADRAL